jgi:hypothetical protein
VLDADADLSLADPSDCASFSITGVCPDSADAAARLRTRGVELDADAAHGYVTPATIEELAAGAVDGGWASRFAAMLDDAGRKGWLESAGRIRGHTAWDAPPAGDG